MDYRCLFLLILSRSLPDAEPGQVVVATGHFEPSEGSIGGIKCLLSPIFCLIYHQNSITLT